MKTIILNVEDLKVRATKLRNLKSQYENCQMKLNGVMDELQMVYKEKGSPLIPDELNLSSSLQEMAIKVGKLADLLEYRAQEIGNANHD